MKSSIINAGTTLELSYPCMKVWQTHKTYALFSEHNKAIIVAVDPAHEHTDFIGKFVSDYSDSNWIPVENYEIVISG